MVRRILACAMILLAPALTGCASAFGGPADGHDLGAVGRGRIFVQNNCLGCHALARGRASPNPKAPPFTALRLRYTPRVLDSELQTIARVGHYGMPQLRIDPGDRADAVAYLMRLK
ncbi:MAG: cytochrome c [Caulobacteraceae bacterium]